MKASTLPEFLDALEDALTGRSGLAGVNIYTCPVAPEDLGMEGVEFADEVEPDYARQSFASDVLTETYQVKGSVLVAASMDKRGINNAAKRARDRLNEVLAEVLDEVLANDTMTGTVRNVEISNLSWHQGMTPEPPMRSCWVEFTLDVTADLDHDST